jgi:hypothetical protein
MVTLSHATASVLLELATPTVAVTVTATILPEGVFARSHRMPMPSLVVFRTMLLVLATTTALIAVVLETASMANVNAS